VSEKGKGPKPRKEAFFIQIDSVDDKTPYFVNVSKELGKPVRFTKPLATCALRVTDDAVLFSMLKLYTRTRVALVSRPLSMPPGPLARLERRLAALPEKLAENELYVEHDEVLHKLTFTRDENGVVSLEAPADAEDVVFELPRTPLQLTMFLPGAKGRTVAVGWIGYQSKPGSPETLVRAAAFALNHLSGLAEFCVISGIQTVKVPASPGRYSVVRPARKADDDVRVHVPVRLWDGEPPQNVGAGTVAVQVDLDTANPVSGRLLLNLTPSKEIEELFAAYRSSFDRAVAVALTDNLGHDDVTDIVCDIALGDVSTGTIGRLREAAETITGFDLTTKQFVKFDPPVVAA
jgi:hypothetical protein